MASSSGVAVTSVTDEATDVSVSELTQAPKCTAYITPASAAARTWRDDSRPRRHARTTSGDNSAEAIESLRQDIASGCVGAASRKKIAANAIAVTPTTNATGTRRFCSASTIRTPREGVLSGDCGPLPP